MPRVIDARDPARPAGVLVDAGRGRPIRWARRAVIPDDPREPGEWEAWRYPPAECKARFAAGEPEEALVVRGRCRLRFVESAGFLGKPSDRRDLLGSLEDARRHFGTARPVIVIPGLAVPECIVPGCRRPAAWSVSDEQEIEPEVGADGRKYERAVCTLVRCYCSRHYQPPRFTSLRGVQSEVPEEVARPQW